MTFSHLNMTANERRRQEQSTALKRFQGVQAVVTLSQLIGTVIIFYSPTYLQVPQYNCQQQTTLQQREGKGSVRYYELIKGKGGAES